MLNIKCVAESKYQPQYANITDACMDLKAKVIDDNCDKITILPNEMRIISSGCKFSIPENYVMIVYPRSSTGIKMSCMLANTTGIIDSGYRDEVKLALYNFGKAPIEIKDGQRIAQFMVIPRPQIQLNLVDDNEDFRQGDRLGGIGSTGQ